MPLLRFDPRLPRAWFHKYQHVYMWATFPLLQLIFQARCGAARARGAAAATVFACCFWREWGR